jgi:hypothetical protein
LQPAAPAFLTRFKLETAENHTCGAKNYDPADCDLKRTRSAGFFDTIQARIR